MILNSEDTDVRVFNKDTDVRVINKENAEEGINIRIEG